jgi:hypothetical protein
MGGLALARRRQHEGMARPDFVSSERAPYAPIVMLIGAVAVIAVVIALLNRGGSDEPLSGSPVGSGSPEAVAAGGSASGSIALLMPISAGGQTLEVGPAAFPPGSDIALDVELPAEGTATVVVALSRMQDDGTMRAGQEISLDVQLDANGSASVTASIETLTAELGPGIYHVELRWQGEPIGAADVTLGMAQPANVVIFDAPRNVTFAAGTYTGVRVDATGAVTDSKPFELGKASGAPAAAFANLNGTPHVLITAGVWAGYWVPVVEGVSLE